MTLGEFKKVVTSFPDEYDSCKMLIREEELCRYTNFDVSLQSHISSDENYWELRDIEIPKGEVYVSLEIVN